MHEVVAGIYHWSAIGREVQPAFDRARAGERRRDSRAGEPRAHGGREELLAFLDGR